MKPSVLSYNGTWVFAGVHAVMWVGAAVTGFLAYNKIDDASGTSDDAKMMSMVSFILPVVIAVVALGVNFALMRDWTPEPWVMSIALGFVDLSLVFSAAVLYLSTSVADTYMFAVLGSLFTSIGAGMAKLFHNTATFGSGKASVSGEDV